MQERAGVGELGGGRVGVNKEVGETGKIEVELEEPASTRINASHTTEKMQMPRFTRHDKPMGFLDNLPG